MSAGSDYETTANGAVTLSGTAGKWVTVTVTSAAPGWVQNAAINYGLVLLQQSAPGSVYAAFCSELGWSPAASLRPRLTITYTVPASLAAYEAKAQPQAPATVAATPASLDIPNDIPNRLGYKLVYLAIAWSLPSVVQAAAQTAASKPRRFCSAKPNRAGSPVVQKR
jgi:hypothetical protein